MLVIPTAEWLLDGALSALKSGAHGVPTNRMPGGLGGGWKGGGGGGGLSGLNSWLPSFSVFFLFGCSKVMVLTTF